MTTHGIGVTYVEIEKQGFWRGNPHTWVNRYCISGATPSPTDATTVINALKTIEGQIPPEVGAGGGNGFVEGRMYAATGGAPIQTVEYNPSLNPATATGYPGPSGSYSSLFLSATLEACVEVRTLMTGLSSSGKPVYARKFFRGIASGAEAYNGDPIASGDLAKITAACAPWKTGLGGTAYVVIGTSGRLMSGSPTAQQFIVNHQVPRGRKRKSTSSSVASSYAIGVTQGAALAQAASPPASSSTTTENSNNDGGVHITVPLIGGFGF